MKSVRFGAMVLLFTNLLAQQTPRQPARIFALIAGVDEFNDAGTEWLKYAHLDAQRFNDYLKKPRSGQDPVVIAVLVNKDATRTRILDALDTIARQAGPADEVRIFFSSSGWATPLSREGFIGTYDGKSEREQTAVRVSDIKNFLLRSHAGRVFLFADVSREQPVLKGVDKGLDNRINNALLDLRRAKPDLAGMLASEPGTASLESAKLQAGLFGYYLVNALEDGGSRPAAGVSFDRVLDTLRQRVQTVSLELVKRPQRPTGLGKADPKLLLAEVDASHPAYSRVPPRRPLPFLLAQAGGPQSRIPFPAAEDRETRAWLELFQDATAAGNLLDAARVNALLDSIDRRLGSIAGEDVRGEVALALEDAGQRIFAQYGTGDQFPEDPRKLKQEHFALGAKLFTGARTLREALGAPEAVQPFCGGAVRMPDREQLRSLEARAQFCAGRALLSDEFKLSGRVQDTTRLNAAAARLACAIELDPGMAEAKNASGIVNLLRANFDEAARDFGEAKSLAPAWAYARHNLALTYIEQGDNSLAEREYREAILRTPYYPYLYYNLGLLLQRENKRKPAKKAYEDSLVIFEQQIDRYRRRSARLSGEGDRSRAGFAREIADVLTRNEAEASNALGTLEESRGKYAEAEKRYRQASLLNPALLPARYNLALLDARRGDRARAKALWQDIVKLDPSFHPARLALGSMCLSEGDAACARANYEAVLGSNADNTEARLGLAAALNRSGDAPGALRILAAATDAQKANPEVAIGLGDLYAKQGNAAAACSAYRNAARLGRGSVIGDKRALKKKLRDCPAPN